MTEEAGSYDVSTEVINGKTGEIKEIKSFQNEFNVEQFLNTVGTLDLSTEQEKILDTPIPDEDIEIRPDGLIYAPWMEYHSILKKAFGRSWGMIPNGMPKFAGNYIYWGHWLIIKGVLCGYAIGEQQYIPKNQTMTYGDAVEGSKSNALMRLCKGIGISLDLWKPSYIRQWKEKYAEQYHDKKKDKNLWRKKNTPFEKSKEPIEKVESKPDMPEDIEQPLTDAQLKKIRAMIGDHDELSSTEKKEVYDWLKENKAETVEIKGKQNIIKKSASDLIKNFESYFAEWIEFKSDEPPSEV